MELPVWEGEGPAGVLRVSAQGLYTLFEARLEGEKEAGLSRLWLSDGGGRCASLGLLEPGKGERLLRRRLSRLELRALPFPPARAFVLPAGEKPSFPAPAPGETTPPEERAGRRVWLRLADGSLRDAGGEYLALP